MVADNSESANKQASANAEPADAELVARARTGDESAFEELFNRHRRRVALIASRFFQRREQIEEIVQESFMKAYFALADFSSSEESAFASWLARIAFNACYDELRRTRRRPEHTAGELSDDDRSSLRQTLAVKDAGQDTETLVIERDLARKLLARLNPQDRLLLVMLNVEELSVADIAGLTGWSASKVKVRAHRARAHLRGLLGKLL
ncbi:MAG TPA: RNA polymerase sigma factor [Pyrinomonadaceae bacterium]|jgi:RNA polymerase sigma-70 factor (ECF subfamily)